MIVSAFLAFYRDSVDPSLAGLAINYSLLLTGALQWTIKVFVSFENAMTSAERLLHFSKLPSEEDFTFSPSSSGSSRPIHLSPLEADSTKSKKREEMFDIKKQPSTERFSHKGLSPSAPSQSRGFKEVQETPKNWPSDGALELSNVYMRYRPDLPQVLKGFSLSVRSKETIGFVGRTGAGKSTIMLAIYRLVEAEHGTITIDGVDISRISLKALRSSLAIIPQDPVMFSGSIRYNLDPFSEHNDADLWLALERARLKSTVSEMPQKLESEVSEGGENWSVGQRQLICIARALLRKTKILIMDEATASVDSNTDLILQQTIRENFADRTVLCIAHRLDTVMNSDRIAVIGGGQVIECGEPHKLLENEHSEFSALAKHMGKEEYKRLKEASSQL